MAGNGTELHRNQESRNQVNPELPTRQVFAGESMAGRQVQVRVGAQYCRQCSVAGVQVNQGGEVCEGRWCSVRGLRWPT